MGPIPASRLEERAAEIDRWVKTHLATEREALISKNARLKALRLARGESKISSANRSSRYRRQTADS